MGVYFPYMLIDSNEYCKFSEIGERTVFNEVNNDDSQEQYVLDVD